MSWYGELAEFKTLDDETNYFVRTSPPDKLLVWSPLKKDIGRNATGYEHCEMRIINMREVSKEELEKIEVWGQLTEDVQKSIMTGGDAKKSQVHERLSKARASRTKKYENVPKELKCKCGVVIKVAPTVLLGRIEKLGVTLQEYVDKFECQSCHPTKGRKPNLSNSNLPKELVCKCGAKVKTNATALKKSAEKKGISIEEIIKNYSCQKCNPTKGLHLRKNAKRKDI
ncbi:MAG TPA: hypothetical protein HA367_00625 [Candidatus Methanofastidiosum sp.]|nr:hypothetical protein [Methanofastidiosum sp.]